MENTTDNVTARTVVSTSGLIFSALESHYRAQQDAAVAQLAVYINSPAGVADHPNIIEECVQLVNTIAAAEDGLRVLRTVLQAPTNQ